MRCVRPMETRGSKFHLGPHHAPTSNQGSVEPFTFACRSVDLLGNEGPITWLNGSVDLQSPTLTLSPNAGETIGLNNTLTLNTSDSNGIAATSLLLTWSNGSSTSSTNVSISTLNWSNSIGQLFTGLSDGTITASAYTVDRLGNSATIASRTWTLNTSNPFISMSLGGTYYGQFITNDSTDNHLVLALWWMDGVVHQLHFDRWFWCRVIGQCYQQYSTSTNGFRRG